MRLEGPVWAGGVGGGEPGEHENKEARECERYDGRESLRVSSREKGRNEEENDALN